LCRGNYLPAVLLPFEPYPSPAGSTHYFDPSTSSPTTSGMTLRKHMRDKQKESYSFWWNDAVVSYMATPSSIFTSFPSFSFRKRLSSSEKLKFTFDLFNPKALLFGSVDVISDLAR
jgi:hypothetical protein